MMNETLPRGIDAKYKDKWKCPILIIANKIDEIEGGATKIKEMIAKQ